MVITCANTWWIFDSPQLEILGPVIIPHAVQVVHPFVWQQEAAESLLHHENVLKDVTVLVRSRMKRRPYTDITGREMMYSALPKWSILAGVPLAHCPSNTPPIAVPLAVVMRLKRLTASFAHPWRKFARQQSAAPL